MYKVKEIDIPMYFLQNVSLSCNLKQFRKKYINKTYHVGFNAGKYVHKHKTNVATFLVIKLIWSTSKGDKI